MDNERLKVLLKNAIIKWILEIISHHAYFPSDERIMEYMELTKIEFKELDLYHDTNFLNIKNVLG